MDIYDALIALRQDARNRGMFDLAIIYGWSLIRMNDELIAGALSSLKLGTPTTAHGTLSSGPTASKPNQ